MTNACVVDEDVEMSKVTYRVVNGRLYLIGIGDVEVDGVTVDSVGNGLCVIEINICNDDICAVFGKSCGDGFADTLTAASDDCGFVFE